MRVIIFLVVVLAWVGSHKALAQLSEIDSLKALLPQAKDTARVNVLNLLSFKVAFSQPQEAENYARESITLADEIDFTRGHAHAYHSLGISFMIRTKYTEAIDAYTKSMQLLAALDTVRLKHRELKVNVLNSLGNIYQGQARYKEALDCFLRGVTIAESFKDKSRLASLHSNIGNVFRQQKEFDKALGYYENAIKFGDPILVARATNNIGLVYMEKEDNNKAIFYYERSLQMKKNLKDQRGMAATMGNLGTIYKRLKKYDEALKYLEESLRIFGQIGDKRGTSISNDTKAEVYIQQKQFKKAKELIDESYKLVHEIDSRESKLLVYERYMDLYKSQGQFEKAMEWLERRVQLNDSLFNKEKSEQIAELETRFETERKEQTIKILEQEKHVQDTWRYSLLGGIGIILVASVSIGYLQRSRVRKTKQLLHVQHLLNEKLKETDKMKSDFFANISHEFRTPLTLIKGPIEDFLEHPDKALTPEKAQMIYRNSDRLLQLVNQLLDLSRLDSGSLKVNNRQGDIHKFLRVVASTFDSYAQQYGYQYVVTIPTDSLPTLFDFDKLEKILYNLLSNAFKFTPAKGTVSLQVQYQHQQMQLEVSDTGIGISEKDIPYIFDRFYQAAGHTAHEGTGIGLSLVKELVSLMKGNIYVTSELGKGTTFTVALPIIQIDSVTGENSIYPLPGKVYPVDGPVADAVEANTLEKETLLIIEDNADMRSFIREQLAYDYRILEATQGIEGFALACCEIPDLIISDIMMPEMDGIALCVAIKKDERTSHIPVIMLTAREGRDSKIEGLETGADDYLVKPFDSQELIARIKNLIAQRQQLRKKFSQHILLEPKNITITSVDGLFLEKVESTIEKYLSQAEFGVPQLQDALSMSKTQLHRKMKALTDQAPGEFLRNYRLKRAAQLLEQQGGNVTEIAFAVGFGSLSYFTRSFKDLFGTSPSAYSSLEKKVKQS